MITAIIILIIIISNFNIIEIYYKCYIKFRLILELVHRIMLPLKLYGKMVILKQWIGGPLE